MTIQNNPKSQLKILSPTAILGYGYPQASLEKALSLQPDAIAVDAGSTDAGPYYLGLSVEEAMGQRGAFAKFIRRDLEPLLMASVSSGIPLIIGSAGFAGGDIHLMGLIGLIHIISEEKQLDFKMATICAEIKKDYVKEKIRTGQISSLIPGRNATENDVEESTRIVGQMGVEPFVRSLEMGANVIVAGRANDPSMFAALPIYEGFDPGLALHMGKILECGAIAAEPGSGSDMLMGTIREHDFLIEPVHPERKCTVQSIAAHSFYEKADPDELISPEGKIDLRSVNYKQETDRSVRVSGAILKKGDSSTIKIEGARRKGYRAVAVAGIRDPAMIQALEKLLENAKSELVATLLEEEAVLCEVHFHAYGLNAVMQNWEPEKQTQPQEVGLVIEVLSETQEQALSACGWLRSHLLHVGFPGRYSTAGNLAMPFSPADISAGPVFEFNIFDVLDDVRSANLFPVQIDNVGRS
jgi:hypothetical protein